MKIYGNAGQAITCENEQTFAGFATRSERDIVADLERRHTVTSPIKLAPLDPKAEKALISRRPKQAPRKPERPAKLPAPRKRTRATTPTAQRQKVARPASGDGQPTKRRRAPQKPSAGSTAPASPSSRSRSTARPPPRSSSGSWTATTSNVAPR
jgi:hypothetical protein